MLNYKKEGASWLIRFMGIMSILFFSYLMFMIVLPYMLYPIQLNRGYLLKHNMPFLLNKLEVVPIYAWRISFYIHIITSLPVIAAGASQFSVYFLHKYPFAHRRIGKMYIFLVLFLSAPSGLIMAFYANGGVTAKMAFILQSVAWWLFTYAAFHHIRRGDQRSHGEFMLRSYALTFSAITLRLQSYILTYFELPFESLPTYIFISWSSWTFNLFIAELFISFGFILRYFKRKDILPNT